MSERLTHQKLQDEIAKKKEIFYNAPFGEPIPEIVRKAWAAIIFKVPPNLRGISTAKVKEIMAKEDKDITRYELGMMLNASLNASYNEIYPSLEDALNQHEELEKFASAFNRLTGEFEGKMEREYKSKASLIQVNAEGTVKNLSVARK